MRSTGEVMATAADFPTAFAKAERAAGRPLPTEGTVFLSVRDADKPAAVPVAAALAGLGFQLLATAGTAQALAAAGLAVERVRKVTEQGEAPTVVDLIRRGTLRPRRQHAAGLRRPQRRLPDPRGRARRPRPLHHDALGRARSGPRDRERAQRGRTLAPGTACRSAKRLASPASSRSGPYTLLRLERGGLEPGIPGQFFMLAAARSASFRGR